MLFEDYRKTMEDVYRKYNKGTLHEVEMPGKILAFHLMMAIETYLQQEAKDSNEYCGIEAYRDGFAWDDIFDD